MGEGVSLSERIGRGAFVRDRYLGLREFLCAADQLGVIYLPCTVPGKRRRYRGGVSAEARRKGASSRERGMWGESTRDD